MSAPSWREVTSKAEPPGRAPFASAGRSGSTRSRFRSISITRTYSGTIRFPEDEWEVAFVPSISDADGVVLAGNGQFTLFGGLQAVGARMPVIALAGYGGITSDVWGVLKGQRLRLTSDDELAVMAARESSPEWAQACVAALISQKQRRDVRRIWRV